MYPGNIGNAQGEKKVVTPARAASAKTLTVTIEIAVAVPARAELRVECSWLSFWTPVTS